VFIMTPSLIESAILFPSSENPMIDMEIFHCFGVGKTSVKKFILCILTSEIYLDLDQHPKLAMH